MYEIEVHNSGFQDGYVVELVNGQSSLLGSVLSVNNKVGHVLVDKQDLGLENVDNVSDLDKPISIAASGEIQRIKESFDLVSGVLKAEIDSLVDLTATSQELLYSKVSEAITSLIDSNNQIYQSELPVGIDSYYFEFNPPLSHDPESVAYNFVNNKDEYIYQTSIKNITKSGFSIVFSENLISSGYYVNAKVFTKVSDFSYLL